MTTTTISFEVNRELKERIDRAAEKEMRSKSSLIRKTLKENLTKKQDKQSENA